MVDRFANAAASGDAPSLVESYQTQSYDRVDGLLPPSQAAVGGGSLHSHCSRYLVFFGLGAGAAFCPEAKLLFEGFQSRGGWLRCSEVLLLLVPVLLCGCVVCCLPLSYSFAVLLFGLSCCSCCSGLFHFFFASHLLLRSCQAQALVEVCAIKVNTSENMANLRSSVVLEARATELGITREDLDRIVAKKVNSFAKFAFATKYVPGQSDDRLFLELASNAINHAS